MNWKTRQKNKLVSLFMSSSPTPQGATAVVFLALFVSLAPIASAIDNGLGITPPRGWRSWNQFGTGIHQALIIKQYEALVDRSRNVDGVPTSLLDLGYASAGIDDGWQKCNSGPNGTGFHDPTGYPIVDTVKFPNMSSMTAKASSLGLVAGTYVRAALFPRAAPSSLAPPLLLSLTHTRARQVGMRTIACAKRRGFRAHSMRTGAIPALLGTSKRLLISDLRH